MPASGGGTAPARGAASRAALLAAGSRTEAAAILDDLTVEDLAEGERVLGDLWQALHPGTPIPRHLDFRMTQT